MSGPDEHSRISTDRTVRWSGISVQDFALVQNSAVQSMVRDFSLWFPYQSDNEHLDSRSAHPWIMDQDRRAGSFEHQNFDFMWFLLFLGISLVPTFRGIMMNYYIILKFFLENFHVLKISNYEITPSTDSAYNRLPFGDYFW